MNKTEIAYSKVYPLCLIGVAATMIIVSVKKATHFFSANQVLNGNLIVGSDFLLTIAIIYLIIKFFIPAIQGRSAIELNDNAIVDNVKKNIVLWSDIKSIEIGTGKTSSEIIINLISHRTISISLAMVKGDSDIIYQKILEHYDRFKKIR